MEDSLDFAYKYPFSAEAKEVMEGLGMKAADREDAKLGRLRLEEAVKSKRIEFNSTSSREMKIKYLLSYVYGRMVYSAVSSRVPMKFYAYAEANRSKNALLEDTDENIVRLCKELGIIADASGPFFALGLPCYLSNAPKTEYFHLINQRLRAGVVYLNKRELSNFLEEPIFREIRKNLPINVKDMPREVVEEARKADLSALNDDALMKKRNTNTEERYMWIERLLTTPIQDVRHRTINIILAPYLITVRKMSMDDAVAVIRTYIDKCKEANPDTDVTESYIRYQCRYAKNNGLKPLSLERAKELLGGIVDFEDLEGRIKR